VAGAVPDGGYILNLSRIKHIGEIQWNEQAQSHCLTVEPGALLTEIRAVVENAGFFFPPDPTETSASIGGMVASNASGARSYAYGPTRNWIQSLRVVLSDGDVVHLTRGVERVQHGEFTLTTESGTVLSGTLPHYPLPQVKNASGYFCTDNMDLLDLFIGMEGTLGIVSEITLRLIPMPHAIHGLTCFFPTEEAALTFVRRIRHFNDADEASSASPLAAIEFVDHQAVDLVRRTKTENDALSTVPPIRPEYHTAVYIELHGDSDEALEQVAMHAMDTLLAVGGNDEDTWYATTARELASQKAFRHAVPESVNRLIDDRKRLYPA
jgi:D-lactate dehydrogenase (cytochrome)